MDNQTHKHIQLLTKNNDLLTELLREVKEENESLKTTNAVLRELLNFFVSVDRREQGLDDENVTEYLNELKKDGFNPPTG